MMTLRLTTLKSGEIRDFHIRNTKHLKRLMLVFRKECQNYDNFNIEYKINDILNDVCNGRVYQRENCIIEKTSNKRYTTDKVYDILSEDFINLKFDEDFINFVDMLNDETLIDIFGETEEDDVLDYYLNWITTE